MMKRPMRWNMNLKRRQVRTALWMRHWKRSHKSLPRKLEKLVQRMAWLADYAKRLRAERTP